MTVLAAIDPERVTPGLLGFTIVVLLGLATWALLRSMDRHLKRVRFEEAGPRTGLEQAAPPTGDPGADSTEKPRRPPASPSG